MILNDCEPQRLAPLGDEEDEIHKNWITNSTILHLQSTRKSTSINDNRLQKVGDTVTFTLIGTAIITAWRHVHNIVNYEIFYALLIEQMNCLRNVFQAIIVWQTTIQQHWTK